MTKYVPRVFMLIFLKAALLANGMDTINQEGKAFAKQWHHVSLQDVQENDLLAPELVNQRFDSDIIKQKMQEEAYTEEDSYQLLTSDAVRHNRQFNTGIDPEEFLFERAESITDQALGNQSQIVEKEGSTYAIMTCKKNGDPYPVIMTRSLHVQQQTPKEMWSPLRVCLQHTLTEKEKHEYKAKQRAEELEKLFKHDPSIESFRIWIDGGGVFHRYVIHAEWLHRDNASTCDHFRTEQVLVQENTPTVVEEWRYSQEHYLDVLNSPHCSLLEQRCLDAETTKLIDGYSIERPCWKEKITFLCQYPHFSECSKLAVRNCRQVAQTCLHQTEYGCALWEKTFHCFLTEKEVEHFETHLETLYGLEQDYDEALPHPNQSLAEMSAKLDVLNEIQKQEKQLDAEELETLKIFKGSCETCTKNVADNLMYDCCGSLGGLATDVKLAHCTAEEIALAEKKRQGLCHYVDQYTNRIFGIKTSTVNVYCCFTSKLARVVHKAVRKQLDISWGTAKHPACRGLTHDELKRVDFSTLDLSEIYEDYLKKVPSNIEAKLNAFQQQLDMIEREEYD